MIRKINAIVTGGSSGLGEATARKILEKGGSVSIFDTQEDKAKILSEEFGESCTFFYTDVTNTTLAIVTMLGVNARVATTID